MFEWALMGNIKIHSPWRIKKLGDGLGITWKTPKPPYEPLSFCEGHRYGDQVYANGADRDQIVAPLFKDATEDILGGVTELRYGSQNWTDVHAARLGLVLPLCASLRELRLRNVGLTARGLRTILEPVVDDKALSKLENLDIELPAILEPIANDETVPKLRKLPLLGNSGYERVETCAELG